MNERRDKLAAAIITLAITLLTGVTLGVMTISPASNNGTPAPEAEEIFFADIDLDEPEPKPVKVTRPAQVNDTRPTSAEASEAGGVDKTDSGSSENPAEPTLVTSSTPQPENLQVKVPEKKEEPAPPPTPTKEELDAKTSTRIKNQMSKTNWSTNKDESVTTEGNANAGNSPKDTSIKPGSGLNLNGRKYVSAPPRKLSSRGAIKDGWIQVRITVDNDGNVTDAKYAGKCSNNLGADVTSLIAQAEKYANDIKYAPDPSKPLQSGVITIEIN